MNSSRKNNPAVTKGELRKCVRAEIAQIGAGDRVRAAATVADKIESIPAFQSARNIMLYSSLSDELPTGEMIRRWSDSRRLFLPKVVGDEIVVAEYEATALHRGKFGILEPENEDAIDPMVLDLIIVPGRVFDLSGRRVGRGGGYYDRFLNRLRPDAVTVGVGFQCQIFEDLSAVIEPHDIILDKVVWG